MKLRMSASICMASTAGNLQLLDECFNSAKLRLLFTLTS
jgi:hypothetical protein